MSRKEKTYHFIYKTTDTRNDNFYVGMHSTDNLNDGYVGSGTRLRRLVYKHGKENFNMEILEYLPDRVLLKQREKEIVNLDLLKEEKCMNLKVGGYGGLDGLSEEILLKIKKGSSNHQIEKWKDPEYRKKHTEYLRQNIIQSHKEGKIKYDTFTGKSHSENTKKILSEKAHLKIGNLNSQFGTCWITNGVDNKKIKKEEIIPNGWKLGRI